MSDISFRSVVKKKVESKPSSFPVSTNGDYRSSMADVSTFLGDLYYVSPEFNLDFLKALEHLSIYNGEFSQAVDNIMQLANTPYQIKFDDTVSEDMVNEMTLRLKTKSKNWYTYSQGVPSLINDLVSQIAINGSLSAEVVPNSALDGVEKIVIVPPKNIKFKFSLEDDDYCPYQIIRHKSNVKSEIELNTTTYRYIALRKIDEKPYGIPPFLSALDGLSISKTMTDNFKYILKKIGAFGFLSVLVNAPQKMPNESPNQYFDRTQSYLNKITPELEKGMSTGMIVGYKGQHEFEMTSPAQSGQQEQLVKIADQKLMSGLKQDPMMFGRQFNSSETLGRVIIAKMGTQIKNYQNTAASFLEYAFLMDLQLAGYPVEYVNVTFDAPMISDEAKKEETYSKKIENYDNLYKQGVISQEQRAQALGFDEADQEEPRASSEFTDPDDDPLGETEPSEATDLVKVTIQSLLKKFAKDLGANEKPYPYTVQGCSCGDHTLESWSSDTPNSIGDFFKRYFDETKKNFDKAHRKSLRAITTALTSLGEGAGEKEVTDLILFHLYKDWRENFTVPQTRIIRRWVGATYNFFRKDKSVFGNKKDGLPEGIFDVVDLRAIDYFSNSDSFYLGKFITDDDLNKKITAYIKSEFLEGRAPIGNNKAALDKFKVTFGNLMNGQDWKLVRILSTTVNKMRNAAAVNFMEQAEVEEYEIVGIGDRLQCPYCKALQGKRFKVAQSRDYLSNTVSSDPEIVKVDAPFITSIYKRASDMEELTTDVLQASGVHFPPYHPSCRDQAIAVL